MLHAKEMLKVQKNNEYASIDKVPERYKGTWVTSTLIEIEKELRERMPGGFYSFQLPKKSYDRMGQKRSSYETEKVELLQYLKYMGYIVEITPYSMEAVNIIVGAPLGEENE